MQSAEAASLAFNIEYLEEICTHTVELLEDLVKRC